MRSATSRPDMVRNVSSTQASIPADQREQIGRLRERIVPDREMARRPASSPAVDQIAVGEQHRRFAFVGLDARGVDRHHVGPVGEIGDAAKAFRLALGAIGAGRNGRAPSAGCWPRGRSRSRSRAGTAAAAAARWSGGRAWRRSGPAASGSPSSVSERASARRRRARAAAAPPPSDSA